MHYIINKIEEDGETPRYKIGSNFFESMPALLRHYTTHYLDTTQLLKPVILLINFSIVILSFCSISFQNQIPYLRIVIKEIVFHLL